MQWHERYSQAQEPSLSDIALWVGSPLWEQLRDWVEDTYQTVPSVEYSRCSGAAGWNVKYKKGSRPLCVLYPRQGYFICMVSIGAKLIPQLEPILSTYSPDLQALYERSGSFQGGKWLMVDVKTPEHLDDVKRLMLLRAKPAQRTLSSDQIT